MKHQFTREEFNRIRDRWAKQDGLELLQHNRSDILWLYAFASYIFEDLEIDFNLTTYFDDVDPESGVSDVDDFELNLCFGQEIDIHTGYYTNPQTYRKMAMQGNDLCQKCGGLGCDDWAGDDCPSDEQRLIRVKDLPK